MDAIIASISTFLTMNSSLSLVGKTFSVVLIVWMISLFVKANRDPNNSFSFNDLVIDPTTGKISGSKTRMNLAFVICSWVIIYYSLNGTLSEWLFGAYLAAFVYDRAQSRTARNQSTPDSPDPTQDTDPK